MTPATAVLLSQANQRTYYEWVRLQSLDQWWHWLLMVAVVGTILSGVVLLYRRDGVELPRAIRWLLSGLRMAALIGLLLYFLQLEKRSEQRTVHHSRLVMMIDTSQSMGLSDADAAASTSSQSRLSAIIDSFGNSPFLQELRARHDLIVYRFDQDEQPEELGILPIV